MQRNEQRPTAIFSVCASSDIQGLERWEIHLRPLEQAGAISVWSARHLPLGTDRMTLLHDHLDKADLIVLLLSSDFFTDDECITLMERALVRHQQGTAQLIPLLLRPVAWRETVLSPFTVLPSDGRPVTLWENSEAALDSCVRDVRRLLGHPTTLPLPQKPLSALQNQNRLRMLPRLRRAYHDLMSQSLQGVTWLELGLADKPDAVQNAANLLLRVDSRPERPLPVGTSITEVYDEAEHELLILGEPGIGKSTLLLALAEHLVKRAEQDQNHPLPVILPLSTWAVKRSTLEDWMAEQIAEIYDVPRKVSTEWVKEERILPLLDGLDEMEETARPACIAAVNAYKRSHLATLVVCSRTTEYEAATSHSRLALQRAVIVQPLTHEDVDACLTSAGKPLTALRRALKKNTALADLATTPLMLNILMLTYQGRPMRNLPNEEATLLQQVWNDYMERMAMRKGNPKRYPLAKTQAWLSYLAGQMRAHNQTVFYLEHLQPSFLNAQQQRTYAWLAVRGPSILIGCLISVLVSPFFFGLDTPDLPFLLQYAVLGGFLGGLWHGRRGVGNGDHRHTSWKHAVSRIAVSACVGLIFGFSFGFSFFDYRSFSGLFIARLSAGVIMAGGCLLLQYRLAAPIRSRSSLQNTVPRGWRRVLHFFKAVQGPRALLVAIITGLSYGLSDGLSEVVNWGLSAEELDWGLGRGLSYGLSIGLSYALICLTLGAQTTDIHLTERMRWTWQGLFKSRHLRITAFLTCISIILIGLGVGLSYGRLSEGLSAGLGTGPSVGLSYWLLLGLYQGMTQERIEDQDRRRPNQGIHRSLRNSVMMSIGSFTILGSMGMLSEGLRAVLSAGLGEGLRAGLSEGLSEGLSIGLSIGLSNGLSLGPIYGLVIGISGAGLFCILTGGLATFRHVVIRCLLARSRTFPMRAPQFLNDATARILLRRVGGGYSFTHRLLLDHLADAAGQSTERASTSMAIHPKSSPSSP